jgi:hypothetical protein
VFLDWLTPDDPTMTGPARGLRTPVPVRSAPELVSVVGKDGEELVAYDADLSLVDPESLRLSYGTVTDGTLRERVHAAGVRAVALESGIPRETIGDWVKGRRTSATNLTRIVAALLRIDTTPRTHPCDTCGEATSRPRYCSDRCAMRHYRQSGSL